MTSVYRHFVPEVPRIWIVATRRHAGSEEGAGLAGRGFFQVPTSSSLSASFGNLVLCGQNGGHPVGRFVRYIWTEDRGPEPMWGSFNDWYHYDQVCLIGGYITRRTIVVTD